MNCSKNLKKNTSYSDAFILNSLIFSIFSDCILTRYNAKRKTEPFTPVNSAILSEHNFFKNTKNLENFNLIFLNLKLNSFGLIQDFWPGNGHRNAIRWGRCLS